MAEAVGIGVSYKCGNVGRLVLRENGVKGVKMKDGSVYKVDTVLLATGAWTSEILSAMEDGLNVKEEERVERQITAAGFHRTAIRMVPEKLQQETLDAIVAKLFLNYVQRTPEYWRMCWDSVMPAQDQLVTKYPYSRLQNLYLAVGGSFQSWKFLPIIGEYVVNVLNGVGNGEEKDRRWAWKVEKPEGWGAHEKVVLRRDLSDLE
ncbi:uncharacterized protein BDZ99DRAFT_540128 [Mytilinidion resinicola]|uniref:FAD dependent oxidoreductase n=1 Tax=Mytilinidion resinicola TaxID=574789 RepID=A0A6A6YAK1_9PEZI|nr:uncharacterized protein BDZ99DRAFT_540128 [Mytilinidion resinicola]KAF2805598.1 hypothetical protein BDZ99DRAFT_540128 [Mytilinidion resinicola]